MKYLFSLVLIMVLAGLPGCSDKQVLSLGPQTWNDLQFVVEARPTPVRTGMNEFIIIVSHDNARPGYDLIISLRVDEKAEWKQAIQDGYSGVYRRAIRINNPLTDVLDVQVRKTKKDDEGNEIETILHFPLNQKQVNG